MSADILPAGTILALGGALIVAFGIGAAALDVREAIHQHQEGRPGLLAAALAVTALHRCELATEFLDDLRRSTPSCATPGSVSPLRSGHRAPPSPGSSASARLSPPP